MDRQLGRDPSRISRHGNGNSAQHYFQFDNEALSRKFPNDGVQFSPPLGHVHNNSFSLDSGLGDLDHKRSPLGTVSSRPVRNGLAEDDGTYYTSTLFDGSDRNVAYVHDTATERYRARTNTDISNDKRHRKRGSIDRTPSKRRDRSANRPKMVSAPDKYNQSQNKDQSRHDYRKPRDTNSNGQIASENAGRSHSNSVTDHQGTRRKGGSRDQSRSERDVSQSDANVTGECHVHGRESRSEHRTHFRRKSGSRISVRSLDRTLNRMSSRARKYAELDNETDSDIANVNDRSHDHQRSRRHRSRGKSRNRSDVDFPNEYVEPRDQHREKSRVRSHDRLHTLPRSWSTESVHNYSITTCFARRARAFLHQRILESTSTHQSDDVYLTTDNESVFLNDSMSPRVVSKLESMALEPIVVVNEPLVRNFLLQGEHFTFQIDDTNLDTVIEMNGDAGPLSPEISDIDESLADGITPEDTDDVIVMLLSNRSPCSANLMMFLGIMQMVSGFITMISGASGFLTNMSLFGVRFESPIAFWCGTLFVCSGVIGLKTAHTKRRSINLFCLGISFMSFCGALFVLVMTSDPQTIHYCQMARSVLYYFHLFLMNVEIIASAIMSFMCLKSIMVRNSESPSEVQVLKTLSRYGLKPEHSVPQLAAAKQAAANRPQTPKTKSPTKSPAPKAPLKSPASNVTSPKVNSTSVTTPWSTMTQVPSPWQRRLSTAPPRPTPNISINDTHEKVQRSPDRNREINVPLPGQPIIQLPPQSQFRNSDHSDQSSTHSHSTNQHGTQSAKLDNQKGTNTTRKTVSVKLPCERL